MQANDWNKVKYRSKTAHDGRHEGYSSPPEVFDILYAELRKHVSGRVHLLTKP